MNRIWTIALTFVSSLLLCLHFSDPNIDLLNKRLAEWNEIYPEEKIYIHTDKPYYSPGDTIWYKVYLVHGQTLLPDTLSRLVYVELIDGDNNVVAKRNQMLFLGGSAGDIGIDAIHWKSGNYQLRAYTKFMENQDGRYTYEKEITILDKNSVAENSVGSTVNEDMYDRLDLQFLPESGVLVHGLLSMIGLKAIDSKTGLGLEIEGEIKDSKGNTVTTFKTYDHGFGKFSFKPDIGTKYIAEVTFLDQTRQIEFPKIESSGSTLSVTPKNESLMVTMRTNKQDGLQGGYIVSTMNSVVVAHSQIMKALGEFAILLDKKNFPEGVMHITLFDKNMVPQAERLVFIEHDDNPFTQSISPDQEKYKPREKVRLTLDLKDATYASGGPQANVSISVTDNAVIKFSENAENIKTQLLLSSELKGKIENPGYYFVDDDPKRKRMLDILMMTQGWRRFEWSEVLSSRPKRRRPKMEEGFTIEGYVSKYEKPDAPMEAFVALSTIGDMFYYDEDKTGQTGKFKFENVPFFDTTYYVLQARLPNSKTSRTKDLMDGKKWNSIYVADPYRPEVHRDENYISPLQDVNDMIAFMKATEEQQKLMNSFEMSVELDEVVISRTRIKGKSALDRDYQLYDQPDNRLVIDSIPGAESYLSVFQLIRSRVAGVEIFGIYPNEIAVIRGFTSILGSNEALYMIDGVPVDATTLSNVPMASISHIDVLKGARAAIYGGGAQNGVIMINLKRGEQGQRLVETPGIESFTHPGPYITRKFYAPKHDGSPQNSGIGIDIRNTLYWAPFVITDSLGHATIEFYTCDVSSTYHVDVQGITFDGRPVVVGGEIQVQ